ncbi:MAG: cysteine desulfurase [Alphaproteobacteria bacterium]|nr:cysteine desulfurase [Alphaproteobacteria bacterium]
MAKRRIYLDWNATAPLAPAAREAMTAAMAVLGNPSSVHGEGRAARRIVEEARARIATLAGARPEQVVFTSGGTEANALALAGRAWLAGASEHVSVLDHAAGSRLAVDGDGRIRPESIPPGAAVALMAANNETGAVHPLEEVGNRVRETGGLWHCDAVQAAGRLDLAAIDADSLALSAHKLGGPMGVGALVLRRERALDGAIRGAQERRRRGGTENVVGIAGFGAVAHPLPDMSALRDRLEARLEGAVLYGGAGPRLGNTSCIGMPGVSGETQVMALDLEGFAVSAGAACSSGKVGASHVLLAMGVDEKAAGEAIRVSLGAGLAEADIDAFAEAWNRLAARLRRG